MDNKNEFIFTAKGSWARCSGMLSGLLFRMREIEHDRPTGPPRIVNITLDEDELYEAMTRANG